MVGQKRYFWESVAWVIAFVGAIELAQWLARLWPDDSPQRGVALVPVVVAMCVGMWVELRQISRMDELHRLMYLIATLVGTMATILFCAVASVGEALQLWVRISPIYAIFALGSGFAVGWLVARRRYA